MTPRDQIAAALADVGFHHWVRVEVRGVDVAGTAVTISLALHFAVATPVCCDEPSCYVPFLGQHRARVPGAIERALGVTAPQVTIRAHLVHEPGFRYINHATGALLARGADREVWFTPDTFAGPP
ncbi:MAG: hypothetical protein SFX73_36700 [Kofleriaceae bacterium]|nr:hypothetical protein [Kofleriaceae bacterium]